MPKLVVMTGARTGDEFPLTGERFVIGRDAACNLRIDDRLASRKHVLVLKVGDTFMVEDLNSSNGTYFNTEPLDRSVLTDGDEIAIGTTVIKYFATGDAAPPPESRDLSEESRLAADRPTVRTPKPRPAE
ncbi:MAG: FHA domain-containing protein [Planctomycetota bacterium]